eukprot:m.206750 g.206750  ORF g.206750 m.206750 type:complete len:544 (-) comp32966_c0_seq2:126-1757(-)
MNRKSGFKEFATTSGGVDGVGTASGTEQNGNIMILEEEEEAEEEEQTQEDNNDAVAVAMEDASDETDVDADVTFVIAQHTYAADNEDELDFVVGDQITLIQQPESGGWWQGELHGNTGWFPQNHVVLGTSQRPSYVALDGAPLSGSIMSPLPDDDGDTAAIKALFVGEKSYVDKVSDFQTVFMSPLMSVDWLTTVQKESLLIPFDTVVTSHQAFLRAMAIEMTKMNDKHVDMVILNYLPQLLIANSKFASVLDACVELTAGLHIQNEMAEHVAATQTSLACTLMEALHAPVNRVKEYAALDVSEHTQSIKLLGSITTTCEEIIKQQKLVVKDTDIESLPSDLDFADLGPIVLRAEADVTVATFLVNEAVLLLFATKLMVLSAGDAFEGRMGYVCESVVDLLEAKVESKLAKRAIKLSTPDGMTYTIKFITNAQTELWACALCRDHKYPAVAMDRMFPLTISKFAKEPEMEEQPPPIPRPYTASNKPRTLKKLFSRTPRTSETSSLRKQIAKDEIAITPVTNSESPQAVATAPTEYSIITAYSR